MKDLLEISTKDLAGIVKKYSPEKRSPYIAVQNMAARIKELEESHSGLEQEVENLSEENRNFRELVNEDY